MIAVRSPIFVMNLRPSRIARSSDAIAILCDDASIKADLRANELVSQLTSFSFSGNHHPSVAGTCFARL